MMYNMRVIKRKERCYPLFNFELLAFILYFAMVLGIGIYFFFKTKSGGEKDYFLGGRGMGAWVSALSAGASDMSSWVLMGLPASILAAGLGQSWIAIGLAIGTSLSWILLARKLRKYSIAANDSITIPQFLTNRFLSDSKALQIVSALVFLVVYSVMPHLPSRLAELSLIRFSVLTPRSQCTLPQRSSSFIPSSAVSLLFAGPTLFRVLSCLLPL